MSQQTLKLLQQNLNSFFGGLKSSNINHKVGFPNYYPSNKFQDDGLCVAIYTNQAISSKAFKTIKNEKDFGLIHLSNTNIKFYSNKLLKSKSLKIFNKLELCHIQNILRKIFILQLRLSIIFI